MAPVARRAGPLLALAAVATLLRLPFIGTIGPDEGGYAYVAWRWAQGHQLYRSVWIDRPQGLILAYRLLISIAQAVWTVRLGAIVAGVAVTLLLVAAGGVVDRRTGLLAGALFATAGVAPHLEGFTFNGELAACVPATAAVALGLRAYRRRSLRLVLAAALLGSTGMLMKQSGFDGLTVVLAIAWATGETVAGRIRRLALAAGAATVPLAASALAGWLTGWSSYWGAIVSSHFAVGLGPRVLYLFASLPSAERDLLPLALLAALGVVRARLERGPARFAALWLVAAAVGVNVGGLYWPHYYVQLLPPLCLLAGIGLARLRSEHLAWAAVAVAAVPTASFFAGELRVPDYRQDVMVKYALGFENDQRIARWVDAHSSPGSSVYALVSRADFYFLAHRPAASRYLWGHELRAIPGALQSVERMLAGARRPRLVVLFQRQPLDAHPRLRRLIARYYRLVWRAPGTGTPVLAAVSRE